MDFFPVWKFTWWQIFPDGKSSRWKIFQVDYLPGGKPLNFGKLLKILDGFFFQSLRDKKYFSWKKYHLGNLAGGKCFRWSSSSVDLLELGSGRTCSPFWQPAFNRDQHPTSMHRLIVQYKRLLRKKHVCKLFRPVSMTAWKISQREVSLLYQQTIKGGKNSITTSRSVQQACHTYSAVRLGNIYVPRYTYYSRSICNNF